MESMQSSYQRFGIGLASLAEKECPGYRKGPAVARVLASLGAVSQAQQAAVMALAEADAREFLRAQGKELCDVAANLARPGALIEHVE